MGFGVFPGPGIFAGHTGFGIFRVQGLGFRGFIWGLGVSRGIRVLGVRVFRGLGGFGVTCFRALGALGFSGLRSLGLIVADFRGLGVLGSRGGLACKVPAGKKCRFRVSGKYTDMVIFGFHDRLDI